MTSIIRTFLKNFSNLEVIKALVAPDARFVGVRQKTYDTLPIYGTYHGPEGVAQFVTNLKSVFDTQAFHVDYVIETESEGAAFGRFEHLVRHTGKLFRSHWAVRCTFVDKKIASYHFYEDTAALEEALEVRTESKEQIV